MSKRELSLSKLIERCMNRVNCPLKLESEKDGINFFLQYLAHEFRWETDISTDGGEKSEIGIGATAEEAVNDFLSKLNKK